VRIPGQTPCGLVWGKHYRDGEMRTEWYAPCGCAYQTRGDNGPQVLQCAEHVIKTARAAIIARAKLIESVKDLIRKARE